MSSEKRAERRKAERAAERLREEELEKQKETRDRPPFEAPAKGVIVNPPPAKK
jgi:hypothetical protein